MTVKFVLPSLPLLLLFSPFSFFLLLEEERERKKEEKIKGQCKHFSVFPLAFSFPFSKWNQSHEAGSFLRERAKKKDRVYFFFSFFQQKRGFSNDHLWCKLCLACSSREAPHTHVLANLVFFIVLWQWLHQRVIIQTSIHSDSFLNYRDTHDKCRDEIKSFFSQRDIVHLYFLRERSGRIQHTVEWGKAAAKKQRLSLLPAHHTADVRLFSRKKPQRDRQNYNLTGPTAFFFFCFFFFLNAFCSQVPSGLLHISSR